MDEQEKQVKKQAAFSLATGLRQMGGFKYPWRVACIILATHYEEERQAPEVVKELWDEAMDISEWDKYTDQQVHIKLLGLATEVAKVRSLGVEAAGKAEHHCLTIAYDLYGYTYNSTLNWLGRTPEAVEKRRQRNEGDS